MSEKDVEEVEKPFVLIVGFFFHNDSILWGLVKPPLPYYLTIAFQICVHPQNRMPILKRLF